MYSRKSKNKDDYITNFKKGFERNLKKKRYSYQINKKNEKIKKLLNIE